MNMFDTPWGDIPKKDLTYGDIYKIQEQWVTVFPIFVEKRLLNSEINYDQSLVYIAGSEEKAMEWCKSNLDIESKKSEWWFTITKEAIDGEYSGIKGLVAILDSTAKEIPHRPRFEEKIDAVSEGQ